MKKIGIITFHRAKNYGAVLQAYALQHTLEQLGSDCEIVDYKCENIDNGYKPFQFSKTDPIKSILKSIVMYRKRAKRIEQFSSFYNNYLKISDKTYSDSDISECKNLYDAFISGSDQVWGPGKEGINPDSIYFLSFLQSFWNPENQERFIILQHFLAMALVRSIHILHLRQSVN